MNNEVWIDLLTLCSRCLLSERTIRRDLQKNKEEWLRSGLIRQVKAQKNKFLFSSQILERYVSSYYLGIEKKYKMLLKNEKQ